MIVFWRFLVTFVSAATMLQAAAWAQDNQVPQTPYTTAVEEARTNMMRDPAAALESAQRAEQLVPATMDGTSGSISVATARWLQSEALTRLGRPEEARPVAESALTLLGANPPASKLFADILLSLGRTQKLTGEHGAALETFRRAFDVYVEIGETRSQAIVLQSIGSIYNDARQYDRAVEYYTDAAERHHDANLDLAAFNNLGNAYTALEDYGSALSYYDQALSIAEDMQSGLLQARILNNIASLHIAAEQWELADESILEAFEAAGDAADAEWGRFLYGVRSQAAFGRGDYQAARSYISLVFNGIPLDQTNQHFTDFHETAAQIYEAVGDYELALEHFEAFKRLDDDSRDFAASANSALVGAQFDFAAQELEIEQLRTDGLERDLALAQSEARQRTMLAIGAGGLLLVLLIIAGVFVVAAQARNRMMKNLLFVDTETGLPTKHALVRDRNKAIEKGGAEVYFAAIKLDRASNYETLLGFQSFIELQKQLGQRLAEAQGVTGFGLIGPGLFGAILDTDDELLLEDEIGELIQDFCRPLNLDGVDLDVSVVVGLAADEQSDLAVRNAIIATSQAESKQAYHAFFNARQLGDPTENLSLMTRMKSALLSGDMVLHYQPKLDIRTGRVTAAEALCRWTDTERGYIPPDDFIPQAEETGKIRELTEWTIHQSIREKAQLAQAGFPIDIAVNISGRLLSDPTFGQRVLDIIGFGSVGLTLEITETAMMHQPETALHNLDLWVDAGCKIAIDDYGTGLSSLSYLKRLPCNELKLDKAFVMGAQTSTKDRTLIKSTVDLAHNLGMTLTAEGVEDELVLAALQAMGCDHAQGYLIAKAISLPDLLEFLRNQDPSELRPRPEAGDSQTIWLKSRN
ncbi:EAL domain-containing protein [Hyphobacterium sp. HN65]|uniref:EAL domain-containing protein n=1 Tax=Hyphobacterium lacteum TaxID=3116575 RepID=A0ABU7LME2_9PROT|nr:EAL domain-containing protein [Hyphobacterium sp. HN65]MEE2525090.1 EAL domain-containing protein [Hyphobacterium sp. HN65]